MKSKDFLKGKLFVLSAEYPATVIKYYFDTLDNDHFICIHPNKDLNDIITREAMGIDREFITNFPDESLSFISLSENLLFDELVYEYIPTPNLEIESMDILLKRNVGSILEFTKYNLK